MSPQLKLVPPSKPRLGLYLRPGRNDHTVFQQLLAEDRAVSGLVLDARHGRRHGDLREALIDNGVHAVLDTNFMEGSSPGGQVLAGLSELSWSGLNASSAGLLRGGAGRTLASLIADTVEAGRFSAVLAPTHYLESASDEMFGSDRAVAGYLRAELDGRGLNQTSVFYPLALPAAALRSGTQRALIIESLKSIDIDALWLRAHPFGTTSAGPIALRGYLAACWELHRIGVPIVAERSGTIGLALMAFGAVGGIESGITIGERFDASGLLRPRAPQGTAFAPAPRVYLHDLGVFVGRKEARILFDNRQMIAALGCRDSGCCRRGVSDTLKDPRRHFVLRRTAEVDRTGALPSEHRAAVYLDDYLRPATDLAMRAAKVLPELEPARRRLESWRFTLGAIERGGVQSVGLPALGQRIHVTRPKPQSLQ